MVLINFEEWDALRSLGYHHQCNFKLYTAQSTTLCNQSQMLTNMIKRKMCKFNSLQRAQPGLHSVPHLLWLLMHPVFSVYLESKWSQFLFIHLCAFHLICFPKIYFLHSLLSLIFLTFPNSHQPLLDFLQIVDIFGQWSLWILGRSASKPRSQGGAGVWPEERVSSLMRKYFNTIKISMNLKVLIKEEPNLFCSLKGDLMGGTSDDTVSRFGGE